MSLQIPTTVRATEEQEARIQECEAVLNHCDQTVQKQAELIDLLMKQNEESDVLLNETINQLIEEKVRNDSWYKNPIIMTGLGIVAGAFLYKEISNQ